MLLPPLTGPALLAHCDAWHLEEQRRAGEGGVVRVVGAAIRVGEEGVRGWGGVCGCGIGLGSGSGAVAVG
jgi:hypothetical protein